MLNASPRTSICVSLTKITPWEWRIVSKHQQMVWCQCCVIHHIIVAPNKRLHVKHVLFTWFILFRALMIQNRDRILLSTHSVPRCASWWYSRMIMSDTWWSRGKMIGVRTPWDTAACFSLPPTTIKPSRITGHSLAIGLDFETDSLQRIDDHSFAYCSFCTCLKPRCD